MGVKLVLSFNAWDTKTLIDLGFISLNLKYTINNGINFGLASEASHSRQSLFAVISLIISLGTLIFALWRNTIRLAIAAGLLAGGGLTNAYERVAYSGVFDYLNVTFAAIRNPYAFNIADISILLGALLLLIPPKRKNN